MFTPRKRQLRKKRFFLPNQRTFALFNGSNLKASKVAKIRLSIQNAKLYSVPLYLMPPKLGTGCPNIMVIYDTLEDLQANVAEIAQQLDCLGICIDNKWYSIKFLEDNQTANLNKKALSLLISKSSKIKR
uniref:Uncharacterized protein n=1 Tax=Chorda asiatica TaxID=1281577 RepID=A0A8F0FC73_9PHAE|nr:hypothetical protein [Chorda asiatica]